jgi:imidazolonepropionase-like amidohydrolase
MGPTGTLRPVPADVQTVEGQGKTLMPGLVDMHVHTTTDSAPPWYLALPDPQHNLQAHLYAGVTTVNDMGGPADELRDERMKLAEDKWLGPRLFFAGSIITHRGGYPMSMLRNVYGSFAASREDGKLVVQIDDATQAALEVRRHWADGATIIKIVIADLPHGAPRLTDEELDAIVAQAHQLGLRVTAHIDSAEDALIAVRHGVDLLAHGIITSALTDDQVATIAKSGITVVPTCINYDTFTDIATLHYQPNAITRTAETDAMTSQFDAEHVKGAKLDPGFYAWGDAIEAHREDRKRNILKLFQAGVPLLVGTDANGSVGTFAGEIHDELRTWVAAGIPPAEVLLSATSRAAHFLQEKPSFGTVEVGKSADLLLIEGDPLQHIEATSHMAMVMVRGLKLDRTPLTH